jgi:hypothetical protein
MKPLALLGGTIGSERGVYQFRFGSPVVRGFTNFSFIGRMPVAAVPDILDVRVPYVVVESTISSYATIEARWRVMDLRAMTSLGPPECVDSVGRASRTSVVEGAGAPRVRKRIPVASRRK